MMVAWKVIGKQDFLGHFLLFSLVRTTLPQLVLFLIFQNLIIKQAFGYNPKLTQTHLVQVNAHGT